MERHDEILKQANQTIEEKKHDVAQNEWKLAYHVAPQANWMNDPNGFVFYKGEYHLFYQHHPFSPEWGPMYWGHAKSKDLSFWEHMPIALAPSMEYDIDGCFSGSAIEKDGKLYLMYTGNKWTGENRDTDLKQVQCLAVSEDGIKFEKVLQNPVISSAPAGDIHPNHFRDPKVWREGDYYYCVLGSKSIEEKGQILLYRSSDLLEWEFLNVAAKGEGNFGFMWECPDIFRLDGNDVLVMSPQGMKEEGDLYHNLHQAGFVVGTLDYQTGILDHGSFELLDYGFDFYAPQTTIDDKGRRILVAWMAMWESDMPEQKFDWAGAMTIPRELSIVNSKMISQPVAELKALRQEEVTYSNILLQDEIELEGVRGDCLELEVIINAKKATNFGLKLRVDEQSKEETVFSYHVADQKLTFDRSRSGKGPGGIRRAPVTLQDGQLHLQIFVDKSSVELFAQGGEKVMTGRIYPSSGAKGIRFFAEGEIELVSVKKWTLQNAFLTTAKDNIGAMQV